MTFLGLRPVVLLPLFLVLLSSPFSPAASRSSQSSDHVEVAMKNVTYHFTDQIAVHIAQLEGYLTPTNAGALIVFDDSNSFTINLASAEIALSCNSLAQVMNQYVFSAADAPIKDLTIASKNDQLIVKGKLHRKGDVAFEATGTLLVEADGRIRLHTEHIRAAHLPMKGLMDLVGIDLARLINTKKIDGISADKDDLILNPEQVFPPPHIHGQITAVHVQGNEIVQVFGSLRASSAAAKQSGNYMAYRHGDLGFGKLTMSDADLVLTDMDPRDSFDFYMDHYKDQLAAGYTKITPEFGLHVYARDYNKLAHRTVQDATGK
jgi:hypothetical protein